MKLRNTILALSMLFGAQAIIAMEQAPQMPKSSQDTATLSTLPAEIKGYLLRFAIDGDLADMERGILVAAATSKSMLNDPRTMLEILNWVSQKVKYTAHAVQLAERLQTRTTTLPVMQNQAVVDWIARTRKKLVLGRELYNASKTPAHHTSSVEVDLIKSYLENPNIDMDWQNSEGQYKTALIKACYMNQPFYAELLLSAGASIDWYKSSFTLIGCTGWMVDKLYKARKEKLALKPQQQAKQ